MPTVADVELAVAEATSRLQLEWAALEELLVWAQFEEGALDARILALPDRAFRRAAFLAAILGFVP
jgi:hypothetical protein